MKNDPLAQRQEEQDKEAIFEIAKGCPLIEVRGEHTIRGWRIRGMRNGETVLEAKGHYLNLVRQQFYDAYSVAVGSGLIKKVAK